MANFDNQNLVYVIFHTPNGSNSMYPCRPGATLVENWTEELDSFNFVLDQVDIDTFDAEGVERGDFVSVYVMHGENQAPTKIRRFVISSIAKQNIRAMNLANMEDSGKKRYYRITCECVSETVMLENIALPNLAHRTIVGQERQLSLFNMINRYLGLYGEIQRTNEEHSALEETYGKPLKGWSYMYTLASTQANIIQTIYGGQVSFARVCPEMQWNQPTLRAVLNDLFSVVDCLPVVREGKIYAMPLKYRGSDVSLDTINFYQSQQKLEDYATDLRVDTENIMGGYNSQATKTRVVEYITPRLSKDSNDYQINNENMIFKTSMPIMDIISVKLVFSGSVLKSSSGSVVGDEFSDLAEFDITPLVVEKDKRAVKEVYYAWDYTPGSLTIEQMAQYQNFCLYYSRGSNDIQGFSELVSNLFGANFNMQKNITEGIKSSIGTALEYFFVHECGFDPKDSQGNWKGQFDSYPWALKIEYHTSKGFSAKAGRYLPYRRPKISASNQTNSYVDIVRFGNYQYSNVDRYGNEATIAQGLYDEYSKVPLLADTIETEKVIYKRTIAFNRNIIVCDMECMPFYVLRSYFFGVNARIRSWQIASGSNATNRIDLGKIYAEFSFDKKNEIYDPFRNVEMSGFGLYEGFKQIALGQFIPRNMPLCFTTAYMKPNGVLFNGKQAIFEFTCRNTIFGNSIVLSASPTDNYEAVSYILPRKQGNEESQDWCVNIPVSYTDENGELDQIEWQFTPKQYYNFDVGGYILGSNSRSNLGQLIYLTEHAMKAGIKSEYGEAVNPSGLFLGLNGGFYKDSMETSSYSMQLEYCSDTRDIDISNEFVSNNLMICNEGLYASSTINLDQTRVTFEQAIDDYEMLYTTEVPLYLSTELQEIWNAMPDDTWLAYINPDDTYPDNLHFRHKLNGVQVADVPYSRCSKVLWRLYNDTSHFAYSFPYQYIETKSDPSGYVQCPRPCLIDRPLQLAYNDAIVNKDDIDLASSVGKFVLCENGAFGVVVDGYFYPGVNVNLFVTGAIEGYEQLTFLSASGNNHHYQVRNGKLVNIKDEIVNIAVLSYAEADKFKHGQNNTLDIIYDRMKTIDVNGFNNNYISNEILIYNSYSINVGGLVGSTLYKQYRSFIIAKQLSSGKLIPYIFISAPENWDGYIYCNYVNWRHNYIYAYADGVATEVVEDKISG